MVELFLPGEWIKRLSDRAIPIWVALRPSLLKKTRSPAVASSACSGIPNHKKY